MENDILNDAQVCQQIGGTGISKNICLIDNEKIRRADMDCVELGGLIRELPTYSDKLLLLCELPFSGIRKIPEEKLKFMKEDYEWHI